MARQFGEMAREAAVLGRDLPATLRQVLDAIAEGEVDVHLHAGDLELLMTRAERLGNRVIAGVLAAALIEALAQMTAVDPDRWRAREQPLFAIGAGATGALASYVIWSARRGQRRRW
jgi:ubiquinone biosynthesis protein